MGRDHERAAARVTGGWHSAAGDGELAGVRRHRPHSEASDMRTGCPHSGNAYTLSSSSQEPGLCPIVGKAKVQIGARCCGTAGRRGRPVLDRPQMISSPAKCRSEEAACNRGFRLCSGSSPAAEECTPGSRLC